MIWRRTPTTPALVRLAAGLNAFASRHQNGIAMLVVVEPGTGMPEAAVRARMARDMKRHESFTRAMALVYEAEGFMAATVRAVVAGLQVLSRQGRPGAHVRDEVEQAAEVARAAGDRRATAPRRAEGGRRGAADRAPASRARKLNEGERST